MSRPFLRPGGPLRTVALFLLPFVLLAMVYGHRPARELAVICVGFLLAQFAAVTLHELGHALAALLLHMRVFMVAVGSGPVVWNHEVRGVQIRLSALPLFGVVVAAPLGPRATRLRMAIYAAAGPLANLATAAVLVRSRFFDPVGLAPATASSLLYLSLALGLGNLLPMRVATPYGQAESDGLRLLRSPWLTRSQLDELWAMPELVRVAKLNQTGAHAAALEACDDLRRRFPASVVAQLDRTVPLISLHRFAEAREELRRLLSRTELRPGHATVAKNNLAWVLALLRDPATAEEAELASRQALLVAPTLPPLQGTRAAVLVWLGRDDEAIPFLERALGSVKSPSDKAELPCLRAELAARRADLDDARRDLDEARALDADGALLACAEAAVAEAASRANPGTQAAALAD